MRLRHGLEARPLDWRGFTADTVALVSFFTLTGVLNERYIAGLDWPEVIDARLIGAPLMVLTARPYGLWRDWVLAASGATGRVRRVAWDGIALISFQVPIYTAILAMSGAQGAELLRGALGVSLIMLTLGRPYGLWLDLVRRGFGTGPGQKPMSLDP